jgi:SAM-dependent methyltransferase
MNFSKEWEKQYSQGNHFSLYPWSDLVALVMRFTNPKKFSNRPKVLELGCGSGANIPFFIDKGFEYFAVEGSRTAVEYVQDRWKNKVNILCKDFTEAIPFEPGFFDLVVDRSSTPHNPSAAIRRVISQVKTVLKTGNFFLLSDWFSVKDSEFKKGEQFEEGTCRNFASGPFADVGVSHFFDEHELRTLFDQWQILFLEHKLQEIIMPPNGVKVARWNFVARKIED